MSRLVLLLLVSFVALPASGCFTVVTPTAARADELAARGEFQKADEMYGKAVEEQITQDEWDYATKRRCDARDQIVRREIATLDATPRSVEELRELRAYARKCSSFGEFEGTLRTHLIAQIEKRFVEQIEPLVATRDPLTALAKAEDLTVDLPEMHPRNQWLADLRRDLAEQTRELTDGLPITASVARRLLATLGEEDGGAVDEDALQRLAGVRRTGLAPGRRDASCEGAPFTLPAADGVALGEPFAIVDWEVAACARIVQVRVAPEEFTEFETRRVRKMVEVEVEVPVSKTTTTVYQSCAHDSRGFLQCRTTGSNSSTVNYSYKRKEWREIEVDEAFPIKVTRTVKRAYATRTAVIRATVESRDGTEQQEFSLTSPTRQSDHVTPETADETITSFDGTVAFDSAFRDQVEAELAQRAASIAQTMRHRTLNAEAEAAYAYGNVEEGRELTLALALTNAQPGEGVTQRTNEAFVVDVVGADVRNLALAPTFSWAPEVVVGDLFEFDPQVREFEGVVRFGYPFVNVGLAATYVSPQSLVGQPNRSTLQADATTRVRFALMSGKYHRGFGLMAGYDGDFHFGKRLGPNYERHAEPGYFVMDEEEPRPTFGMSVSVSALLGVRARKVAVFAGVRPQYNMLKLGYFLGERANVGLSTRLEARWVERYPLIVEAWWGGLGELDRLGELTEAGVTVDLPLSHNLWLRLNARHHEHRANFYGLWESDDIFIDRARIVAAGAGVSYSF